MKIPVLERALVHAEGREIPPGDGEAEARTLRKALQHRIVLREVRGYFDRILMGKQADIGLECLNQLGVLEDLLPEVHATVGFGGKGHKALWPHIKQVVMQTPAVVHLRWAALYHDVGKVICFKQDEGKVSFHGHEVVSARLWGNLCRRMAWYGDRDRRIGFLVEHLGHVESYEPSWTDSAVRRVVRDMGKHFDDLVALSRADMTTASDKKYAANQRRIDELVSRVKSLEEEDQRPRPRKGLGLELEAALGIARGPELGRAMKAIQGAVEARELAVDAPVEEYVVWLRSR